jgi:hypothetical protein
MNLTDLRYYPRGRFFWDERGGPLEQMVLMPIRNPIEMGADPAGLPRKLAARPYYPDLFRRAFGDPAVTDVRIGRALSQFLRSLVSYRSRFDEGMARAHAEEDPFPNFTQQENHGKALFFRNCGTCHFEADEAAFAMLQPRNNGTELDPLTADGGIADITLNARDAGRFKSPTLRNVEVAGPYMHDGSLATLEEVVEHYSNTFKPHPNLDSRMVPLHLTPSEKAAVVAFLKTLTDRAFLTDPRFSDPFDPVAPAVSRTAPALSTPLSRTPLPAAGDVETVVARVLSFDSNRDGRVGRAELPDRMGDLVTRGDRNGDRALDREEVRALTSSAPEPATDFGFTAPAPRFGPQGLIGDLALPADRQTAALAVLTQVNADATAGLERAMLTFRQEAQPVVLRAQSATLDERLRAYGERARGLQAFLADVGGTARFPPVAVPDLAIEGLTPSAETQAQLNSAAARLRQRTSQLLDNRAELLRRLKDVLTPDELSDFESSVARHATRVAPPDAPAR